MTREVRGLLERIRVLLHRSRFEEDLDDELRFHLEESTRRNIERGMFPKDAKIAARRCLGRTDKTKDQVRKETGVHPVLNWLDTSWLDFKLGVRVLVRYPALTIVGGLGMAVAIAIVAIPLNMVHNSLYRPTSLENVIKIRNVSLTRDHQARTTVRDFNLWRAELASLHDLGAYRETRVNAITEDGRGEPYSIVEITPSAFRIVRQPPLLGRTLVDEDALEGMQQVVLLGYDVWRSRFGCDSAVVGKTLHLGSTAHSVVGVMPEGFGFPKNHRLWTPLSAGLLDRETDQMEAVSVFGRLIEGASIQDVRTELAVISNRAAITLQDTIALQETRVEGYAGLWLDDLPNLRELLGVGVSAEDIRALGFYLVVIMLVLLVLCANVAILVFARTARRQGEIAVRKALGASRRRIVTQLTLEAFGLAVVAAALAMVIARVVEGQLTFAMQHELIRGEMPYWIDLGVSSTTFLYVLGVAAFVALFVGVFPALQATRGTVQSGLRNVWCGTSMQLGRTWTALIVAQVGVSVAILPLAGIYAWSSIQSAIGVPRFQTEEYLTAQLEIDESTLPSVEIEPNRSQAYRDRFGVLWEELEERLEAEPSVSSAAFAWWAPGTFEEPSFPFEAEGKVLSTGIDGVHRAFMNSVDLDFFSTFDLRLLAGRGFGPDDHSRDPVRVIVDQSFVSQVFDGEFPVGRRVRLAQRGDVEPSDWYEIVGVVSDLPTGRGVSGEGQGRIYAAVYPYFRPFLAIRMEANAVAPFMVRLRDIAAALDPTLRLSNIRSMDELYRQDLFRMFALFLSWTVSLTMLSGLALSAVGIYTLSSFAVAQRKREIGIRAAMGADPHRLLGTIFSRTAMQLGVGVVLGAVVGIPLATAAIKYMPLDESGIQFAVGVPGILPWVAVLMIAIGLAGAVGPARRGLRVQATDALKEG